MLLLSYGERNKPGTAVSGSKPRGASKYRRYKTDTNGTKPVSGAEAHPSNSPTSREGQIQYSVVRIQLGIPNRGPENFYTAGMLP